MAREHGRVYQFKLENVHIVEGFNKRINTPYAQEKLFELATSIAAVGIKEVLSGYMVNDEDIAITNGHRRMAAVQIANKDLGADITTVPIRIEPKFSNEVDFTEGMLIRNSGEPLTLLEQSDIIKVILNYGKTEEHIANHSGYSIGHIKNLVILCSASEGVRQLIINGFVSASNAIEAIRKFGAKAQEVLTEAITQVEQEGEGKKRVTQKQLKKGVSWKVYGPKLHEMLELMCYSADIEEVRNVNKEDAKALLLEIAGQE